MLKTVSVTLTVDLPEDLAANAEEVQRSDPEFLSRVVQYGLTRRAIYRHLRDGVPADEEGRLAGVLEEDAAAKRAVIREATP